METKQEILHKYRVERKSLRSIARELHLNRKTVTRIVREYESAIAQDPENGLGDYLSQKPIYHPRPNQVRVLNHADKRIAISNGDFLPYGDVYYVAIEDCDSIGEVLHDEYEPYVVVCGHKIRAYSSASKANKATHYEVVVRQDGIPCVEHVLYEPTLSGKKIRVKKLSRKYCK